MPHLTQSLAAWNTPAFAETLQQELANLPQLASQLQQAMEQGSALGSQPPRITLLASREEGETLMVRIGIFYSSIIAGCNCADDPGPMEENTEYCQLALTIHKATADLSITPIAD
jgi:hypothetical protein